MVDKQDAQKLVGQTAACQILVERHIDAPQKFDKKQLEAAFSDVSFTNFDECQSEVAGHPSYPVWVWTRST